MEAQTDKINSDFKVNTIVLGYKVKRVIELQEIASVLYELEHIKTGARHIHISNSDKENTFSVSFKTIPSDSTGVAHILEHTVLCGSAKFPVRDPFFSMIKRSLNTFMNAFTASDWTMYPFSTQNKKDFYNLMDIYLDAVFFPKLDALSFKQEGHRLEIELNDNPSDPVFVYKGVVYNEMKGAMSSPDQVMIRSLFKALYPDTTYSYNSGGDPADIPKLTHKQLKNFHKRHYHPSNSFFYTYGNIPLKKHLVFIENKILKNFDKIDPKTEVINQPRWETPKTITATYPLDKNEDKAKKSQVCVAWLTADIKNSFEILCLTILEQILLGNSASPLRKALIDSELGTALCDGTGFHSDNRDSIFVCGLKDVKGSDANQIEKIIFDVLNDIVKNGIDKQLVDSAIHQIEFHRKEITNNPYPYGIKLLFNFAECWFHGGDPEKILKFDKDLEKLQTQLANGPFLEKQITTYFLNNSHKVLFSLIPDQSMEEKENQRVKSELEKIKSQVSQKEIEKLNKDKKSLKELQEAKEDLSSLPTLELDDIPPEIIKVKETISYPKHEITCYQQPTSGIFYINSVYGIGSIEQELLPLIPFFCTALTRVGTAKHDYTQMARLIDLYTGGLNASANVSTTFDKTNMCLPFISLNGKSLVRNRKKMFSLIEEFLCDFEFSNLTRLKSLLFEYRAGMESAVVHNGHRLAISLASRNFSTSCFLNEMWHGIYQLDFIKNLTNDIKNSDKADENLNIISSNLRKIAMAILKQNNVKTALIGEKEPGSSGINDIIGIYNKLGVKDGNIFKAPFIELDSALPKEGWSTHSSVSFVADIFKTVRLTHEDAPCLSVISKLLRSLYLHREIREKGGAYGGFSIYNIEDGLFCFASYRDPHIYSTLKVYEQANDFIKSGKYTSEDIKEAILQVCSDIDKPDTPASAARKAFYRKLIGLSDDLRQAFKEKLLKLQHSDIIESAEKYFNNDPNKHATVVISSQEKLLDANKKLEENPFKIFKI